MQFNCSFFSIDEPAFNNILKSIVREYKWTPDVIGSLFFDRQDYTGLLYWYDDVIEICVGCCTKIRDVDKLERENPQIDKEIFEAQRNAIRSKRK